MEPLHVAAWIEGKTRSLSAPTVKQHLAAIRHLFDWLVNVRSYRSIHLIGAWPVACGENRQNADIGRRRSPSPDCQYRHQHTAGLRDRALIALMVYSFARIGAAVGMKVEDVYTQNHRLWVRLREKDGKRHEGFISKEAEEIELLNAAGETVMLPAKDVDTRKKLETSVMPEGIVENLTMEEFGHLLAYLESLKTAK